MKDYSGAPQFALNFCRILVGFFFMLNGVAKIWGVFGRDAAEVGTLIWWAGAIETVGGFLLMIGLATRIVAFILMGQMVVAYYMVHLDRALLPSANQNGGERAFLYGLWFFYFTLVGGGSFSVDGLIASKRRERAG